MCAFGFSDARVYPVRLGTYSAVLTQLLPIFSTVIGSREIWRTSITQKALPLHGRTGIISFVATHDSRGNDWFDVRVNKEGDAPKIHRMAARVGLRTGIRFFRTGNRKEKHVRITK